MNTHDSDKQIRADLLQIARKVGYANSVEQLVREASTLWSFVEYGPDDSPAKSCGPVEQVFLDKFGINSEPLNKEFDSSSLPAINIPTVWCTGKEFVPPISFTVTTSTDESPKEEVVTPEPEKSTVFQEGRDAISGVSAGILNHYVKMGMWNYGDDLTNLALLAFAKKNAKTEKEVLHCSYDEREEARNAVNRLKSARQNKVFGTPLAPEKYEPDYTLPEKKEEKLHKGRYETCTKEEVEEKQFKNVTFDDSPMAKLYKKFVLDTEDYDSFKKDQTDTLEQLNTLKVLVEKLAKDIVK